MDEIVETGLIPETGLISEMLSQIEFIVDEVMNESDGREVIPENSPTLLIDESTSRFSSAVWFNKVSGLNLTLAGLGGIGSYTAFLLSRLKPSSISIYDDDIVDGTNMSGQMFSTNDIGLKKTDAVCRMVLSYSGFHPIFAYDRKFDYSCPASNIMICGFDSMSARKDYYKAWKTHVLLLPSEQEDKCLFIDGRLAAEEFQVFCMKGTDRYLMDKYEKEWLFSDSEAEATLCSYKQTSFCANMIASVMVNLFVNFVTNLCDPVIERELPFYTYYNAERMIYRTETV